MDTTTQPGDSAPENTPSGKGIHYKWVALSNTTIATFMATVNGSIILISLPAIFNGISINPLTSFQYLLWMMMGYGLVTATLLLSFGRLSDMYGRVRLYNIGFAVFTAGSILLFLTPDTGDAGAIELISFRLLQAVGAAFIFSNSAAILTDAFPPGDRGVASGMMSTLMNSGVVISMGMFFTIIVVGLTREFPAVLSSALTSAGAAQLIPAMSQIPPTGALFAAFLGYNPVQMILAGMPLSVTGTIPLATLAILTGVTWFPTTLAHAFMPSLASTFIIGAILSLIAAAFCAKGGEKYVHDIHRPGARGSPRETGPQQVSEEKTK